MVLTPVVIFIKVTQEKRQKYVFRYIPSLTFAKAWKHSTVVSELVFSLLKHLAKPFPPLIESSLLPFERQRYGTFPAQRKFSFIPLKRTSEHVWLCLARQGLQCKHTPGIVYYRFILTSCTITLSAVEVQTTLTTRNELLLLAYVLWIDILSSLGFGIHSYI